METKRAVVTETLLGYFEEVSRTEDHKHLGIIIHASLPPDRKAGYENRKIKTFGKGETVLFHKAHKGIQSHTFRKTVECYSIYCPLWGRSY